MKYQVIFKVWLMHIKTASLPQFPVFIKWHSPYPVTQDRSSDYSLFPLQAYNQ